MAMPLILAEYYSISTVNDSETELICGSVHAHNGYQWGQDTRAGCLIALSTGGQRGDRREGGTQVLWSKLLFVWDERRHGGKL